MMLKLAVLPVAVAATLAATNPGEDQHRSEMIDHANQSCGRSALERSLCGSAMRLISAGMGYHDHILFSSATLGGVETLGLLGQVIIVKG